MAASIQLLKVVSEPQKPIPSSNCRRGAAGNPASKPSRAAPRPSDAEANVIRNLMERIDQLEGQVRNLQDILRTMAAAEGNNLDDVGGGRAQNLKDREILEFLGD